LLKRALGLGEGVAQREQDRPPSTAAGVDRRLEGADDRLGEDAIRGSQTNQGSRLDILNDLLEGAELMAVVSDRAKYFLCSASLSPRSLVTRPLVSTS